MSIDSVFLTKDSIKFLLFLAKKNTLSMTKKHFCHDQLEADFYSQPDQKLRRGTIVVFHGLNQEGNNDARILKLVGALVAIGFTCLVPRIPAYVELRSTTEYDFDSLTRFLDHLSITTTEINGYYSFLGPSTSCLFMSKLASKEPLKPKIKSLCLISPYFSAQNSFAEILESPKSFYAQLVLLKMLLHSQYMHEKNESTGDDINLLNQAITFCFQNKKEEEIRLDVLKFINRESSRRSTLYSLVRLLGKKGFITDSIRPFFLDISQRAQYEDHITKIDANVTIIHSLHDDIFSPKNSVDLSQHLNKYQIKNSLLITKLLEHADLKFKNILKEAKPIINSLNYFFSHTQVN